MSGGPDRASLASPPCFCHRIRNEPGIGAMTQQRAYLPTSRRRARCPKLDCGTPYCALLYLKVLFCAQRKLYHSFEQLVCGQACEIVHDQLLNVEPHEIAKLQGLAA